MSNGIQSAGIITRRYKHGSVVYFEGDKSEYVYILKGGRIILTSTRVDTGEEVKEEIKSGEFFGVKSALGKYPREETAQTIGETVLLVLPLADFERLVLQNVNVVRKMLRIFSNQLRRIGKSQREVLGESESINPADELFKIGEYYYKMGRVQQAQYAYKRYMEYYPDGKFASNAMQRIKAIEAGSTGGDLTTGVVEETPSAPIARDEGVDLTDFSIDEDRPVAKDDASAGDFGLEASARSPISSEMDDFFANDKTELDDFSFNDSSDRKNDISEMFYDAMSKFSQENYNDALNLYKEILDAKNLKNEAERKVFEKANFEIGRCYLKLGKYSEALNALSDMIKKFPKSEHVKNALFHIGLIYESVKKTDKAVTYYTKVASMEPKDSINKLAAKRLGQLQNDGRK